ncbi:MAG: S26 family signal peptidase, partial [Corynebacterium casei]|nr:S26 family signal peptidase [Corynebacterium casei]
VMGDNRTNSLDSRYHMGDMLQGTIPTSNVKGRVRAVFFPEFRAVPSETI